MQHYVQFSISEYPELVKKINAIDESFVGLLIPNSTKTAIDHWSECAGVMNISIIGSISEFLMILGDILEGQFEFLEE